MGKRLTTQRNSTNKPKGVKRILVDEDRLFITVWRLEWSADWTTRANLRQRVSTLIKWLKNED